MGEMRKTTATLCQQCKYSLSNGNGSGSKYAVTCAYLEITKKRRNCEVGLCDKFEAKKKKAEQAWKITSEGEIENEEV